MGHLHGLPGAAARSLSERHRRPRRRALAWFALLGPFFYASYGLANYFTARRLQVPSLVFAWESYVPFWPWTIFPYWTINIFYALSLFLAATRRILDRHAARLLTAQLLAVSCFLLWPLRFSFGQPAVSGAPALLFDALRSFDAPFNQAPSLHIALAVVLWDFHRRLLVPAARWLVHAWTLAVCLSVLTTYQHHFIDIPTGALLGVVCVWLWPLERRMALPALLRPARDLRRWRIALWYVLAGTACAVAALLGYEHGGGAWLWLAWPAVSFWIVAVIHALLGERGFGLDAQGRMDWSARWLLAPHRWLARLNAQLWTARAAATNQVAPGLWLGRLPSARAWRRQGEPVLVSLCAELLVPAGASAQCVPLLDLTIPSPHWLLKAARAIERAQRQQRVTHVCCALGFSRSAAVLACWLVLSERARDLEHALRMIRTVRPQIVLGDAWLAAIDAALTLRRRRVS
jgi:protein-tyrosine phosphatase